MQQWHKNDLENRMYVNTLDNKKASMPRYYKDKIYNQTERKKIAYAYQEKMGKEKLEEFYSPDFEQLKHNKKEAIKFAHSQQLLNYKKDKL